MIREYFQMRVGVGKEKKNGEEVLLFLFVPQHRRVVLLLFSRTVKTISGLRKSVYSVAWFAGVTPCSHRANPLFPIQNGLHIFPVTQGLKRMTGKSRGWGYDGGGGGHAAIITGFTCSQLLSPFMQLFWKHGGFSLETVAV